VWTHTGGIETGEGDGPARFAVCRRPGGRGDKPRLRRSALVGRASTEGITEARRTKSVRPRQVNLCMTGMMRRGEKEGCPERTNRNDIARTYNGGGRKLAPGFGVWVPAIIKSTTLQGIQFATPLSRAYWGPGLIPLHAVGA
jgi:hypothetical protein